MTLSPGKKLGPYEIVSPIGAGGMGEVYRARDTRLDRTVAIKVLPAQLSSNPEAKQRLEREARAISSLNHPNICTLHDVGHMDGVDFLVMELVVGETLEQRLVKGPLPLEQAARYGALIADALAKAHKLGITHRDLKPANIMLTKTGAKLMDFGLAKQADVVQLTPSLTQLTVEQSKLTREGTLLGTFQYMAPEQLEGKEADPRTDIFALGEVIYEMATGRPAFAGKSRASLIAAILTSEPQPMAALQPMMPQALERVVKKCLAKDPEERWQSANDLSSELSWVAEAGGQMPAAAPLARGRRTRGALALLVSCALVAILIVGAIWWRTSKPPEEASYFFAPLLFPAQDVAVAPNGHTIAIVAYSESARKNAVWIYELGSPGSRVLAETEGATYPFWSPDGQSLAFFADAKLKKLELSGGPLQSICDAPSGRGGTWNKDGVIVFTPAPQLGVGLSRVSALGGTSMPISKPDISRQEQSHRWPMFLPDGKHFLYFAGNFSGQKGEGDAIYVGSLDSNEKRFVVEASANAAYVAPGYLLFPRDKTLFAQRFDLKRFVVTGEPTPILTELQYQPQLKRAVFAASDSRVLVAQSGSGIALSQPVWFDRRGNELGAVGKPDVYVNVSIAPDGRSAAIDKTDLASQYQTTDIWTYELHRDSAKRLTFGPGTRRIPIWSPDGSRLVFSRNDQLRVDLYMKDADGAQEEKLIVSNDLNKFPNDWSRDGNYLLYNGATDLWFARFPELKSTLLLKAPSSLRNGQFSPDGKWVAYASNETGKWEIYVTSFPDARGKWLVSASGGEQPRWRADGKELFYLSSDSKMMAVPVTTGAKFDAGSPVALFQATPRQGLTNGDMFVYDVSRDGQRFLINTSVKHAEAAPMSIVLNWPAKLSK